MLHNNVFETREECMYLCWLVQSSTILCHIEKEENWTTVTKQCIDSIVEARN